MARAVGLGAVLFSVWLLLSGHYEPLILGFGVGSCALVVFIAHRMDVVDHEGVPYLGTRLVRYIPWLMKEIFIANVKVAKIILHPRLPISPIIVHFRGSQRTDMGRFLYANSVTLTPGTITTGVDGNEFEIHALTLADVDGREEDEMDRRCSKVEWQG